VFVLEADLARARVKDSGLPRQRVVLLLGLLVAAVRKLTDWLGEDSLAFDFLFVEDVDQEPPRLAQERELLELILREPIAGGTVSVARVNRPGLAERIEARARRSLCHVLAASTEGILIESDGATVAELVLNGPSPTLLLIVDDSSDAEPPTDPRDAWLATSARLLASWT
jgi:hypothetical protein